MEVTSLEHKPAVVASRDTTITDIAALMRNSGAGSVVIIDEHGHLVGIVTDRDIVVRALASGGSYDTQVAEVMTADPVFVYEQQDIQTAGTSMVQQGCRRLPVLDATGAVCGVIALDDLLRAYAGQIDALAGVVGAAAAWDSVKGDATTDMQASRDRRRPWNLRCVSRRPLSRRIPSSVTTACRSGWSAWSPSAGWRRIGMRR